MQIGNNIKGMQTDINNLQKSEDIYSFALNATVEHFSEEQSFPFLGNTPSNIQCLQFVDSVNGYVYIPELDIVVMAFLNTTTNTQTFLKLTKSFTNLGDKKIVSKDSSNCLIITTEESNPSICEASTLFQTNCLNWSIRKPLQLEYKITDCTLNIYFVNGLDEDRFVYFNLDDFSLADDFKINISSDDCAPNYINQLDCEKTKWYPNITLPCIKGSVISGGSKSPGKYRYLIAYSTNKGIPLTSYSSLNQGTNIFSLKKDSTDKGIKLKISNVEQKSRYRYFHVVGVEVIKGITSYKDKGVYPVSQSEIFDTDNSGNLVSLKELISLYPFYKSSENITISNDIFFKSNLFEYDKFNLQPVINTVEVEWITTVLKEGDYKDPEKAEQYVSFLRDEVYALGIEPILSNLEKAPTFPLIGREAIPSELVLIGDNDVILDNTCSDDSVPTWKARNTAIRTYKNSLPLSQIYSNCSSEPVIYEKGTFGYHESVEKYPNVPSVWGELCGQPIRHFRFPDHTQTVHHSNDGFDSSVFIFPLGVQVKSNMSQVFDSAVTLGLISQEQRNRIVGWKLVRSNRLGNKSVIAKGLLFDMWKYNKIEEDKNFSKTCTTEVTEYFYPNYPFNDLNPDPFLASTSYHYKQDKPYLIEPPLQTFTNKGRYTFHSPDTHFTEPDLGNILKLEAIHKGESRGFFNIAKGQAEYKILSWKHFNIALSLGKWIANTQRSAEQDIVQQQSENLGSGIGSAIGTAVGLPSAGAALGGILGSLIGGAFYKNSIIFKFTDSVFKSTITFSETEKFINLFKNIIKYKQYHYQYQAVGKYNSITPYTNYGNKQRLLEDAEYLNEGKYTVKNTFINNFNRESSVYLRVNNNLPTLSPSLDTSRVLISDSTQPSSTPFEEVIINKCSKFYIRRTAYQGIRLGIWGKLCTKQLLTPNELAIYLDQTNVQNIAGTTYYVDTINGNFNGISHEGGFERVAGLIEIVSPTQHFIVEELIWAFNTRGGSTIDPPNIEETTKCYQYLMVRPTRGFLNPNEEDNKIYGEEFVQFGEKTACPDSQEIISYIEEKGCNCNKKVSRPIGSYYGSIKQQILNQYGNIFDINWVSTSSCLNEANKPIFGGDTYLNRFALKRKHSFFNMNTFEIPNDFEINYSLLANVAYPIYYFDTNPIVKEKILPTINGINLPINYPSSVLMSRLFPVWGNTLFNTDNYLQKPKYKLDCSLQDITNKVEFSSVEGLIYLYNYGICSFVVESDINLDLRDAGKGPEQDFYPNVSDLSYWLQEETVKPKEDNHYIYDKGYSSQPIEELHYLNDVNFKGVEDCETDRTNRVIYTSQGLTIDDDDSVDNYLVNKALDYHDFSKKDGKITSIEGLEGDKVLVRQEDASAVYGAYIEINTDQSTALISAGNIFKNKPIQFSRPTLGYFGSQHRAILHTPFGHVTVDAKRGNVFLLANNASNLEEISNKGMKGWFKENLPFKIQKYFNEINIDNSLNGIGISLCYDKRFNTFYLTKLDYEPTDPRVRYNNFTEEFYLNNTSTVVSLDDKEYFCNKSWTISYNFYTQQWQSFHSFTPRFYIDYIDHFASGIKTGLWNHNVTNKDYQRYYGTLYPFVVETITKGDLQNHIVKNVSFLTDTLEYFNDTDFVYNKEKTFNKAIVFNDKQNSGLLSLENVRNNLFLQTKYPIIENNLRRILLSSKENFYSFNQFKDIVSVDNIPLWITVCNSPIKELNNLALNYSKSTGIDYLRDLQTKIRLIQDKEYIYKIIFKGTLLNDGTSRRL